MKKIFSLGLFITLLVTTNTANAAGWFKASINRIQIKSDKIMILVLNSTTNHECGSVTVEYEAGTDAGADWLFSALLTYEAAGREVEFYITHCNSTKAVFNRIEGDVS